MTIFFVMKQIINSGYHRRYSSCRPVVLKLGSTEPQGFGEAVAGVRLRSE